jgi:hypothetical protein
MLLLQLLMKDVIILALTIRQSLPIIPSVIRAAHRVNDPQTSQSSRQFWHRERVRFVFVKVSERRFELFQLRRGKVGHIFRDDL